MGFAWFIAACSSSDNDNDGDNNPPPPSFKTFQAATVVLGQADFTNTGPLPTSEVSAKNGSGAMAFYQEPVPTPSSDDDTVEQLMLPVYGEHRVLIYSDGVPDDEDEIQQPADLLIGQSSFNSSVAGVAANQFNSPTAVHFSASENSILVSDNKNYRVMVYQGSQLPLTASPTAADIVIGQLDDVSNVAPNCNDNSFEPQSAIIADGKLWVVDGPRNRVLVFNTLPTATGTPSADFVLGQLNLTSCSPASGESRLNAPSAIWSDGSTLIVVDTGNNRVLVWNDMPTTSAEPADVVIGQINFTFHGINQVDDTGNKTIPSAATLRLEDGPLKFSGLDVSSDGQLCIADTGNNRVLLWDEIPTSLGEEADTVLGQDDFDRYVNWDDNQDGANDGVASARTFSYPTGCLFDDDDNLVIADYGTSRYLVFEKQP